jgi:hypothetical protein
MVVEHYAQRLLNPFRGAVHTIRYASAEAVTTDGVHWEIYVRNDELLHGLDDGRRVLTNDIRYGSWSADKGLKRGPLHPSEDFLRMEEIGTVVYEYLTRAHRQVPFTFRDRFELWLLDEESRPLALLHSALARNELDLDLPIEWRAGFAARERFASPSMDALNAGADTALSAGDYLTRYVNARAGRRPAAQWFQRESDGAGAGLQGIGLPGSLEGRTLAAEAFPRFLLADSGHDETHGRLVADYLRWQAPWLLLLPLDTDTRRALEHHARAQATEVFRQFRLYPQIVDDGEIKTALVEAVLRLSQLPPEKKEDVLTTFYIELSPYTYE